MTEESREDASGAEGGAEGRSGGIFGGMTPQEAGRLGAQVRRERQEAAKHATADVTPERLAKIVDKLGVKAEQGDVAASRELREWLRQAREEGERPLDVLSLLTPEQRATVRGWLSQAQEK